MTSEGGKKVPLLALVVSETLAWEECSLSLAPRGLKGQLTLQGKLRQVSLWLAMSPETGMADSLTCACGSPLAQIPIHF